MSTHIIDNVVGIKLPLRHKDGEEHFVIVHEGGDNNMFDCITNRRSRSWYMAAFGSEYEILKEACRFAEGCCGGGIRFSGHRHTEPETFIRRYRSAMKDALTLQQAVEAGISVVGRIKLRTKPDAGQWKLEQLMKHGVVYTSKPDLTDGTATNECAREFDLRNQADFDVWFDATNDFLPSECLKVTCYDYRPWVLKRLKQEKTREKAGVLA